VFVSFGIQHAMRMSQIVICGLSGSTVPFHIISLTALFQADGFLLTRVYTKMSPF